MAFLQLQWPAKTGQSAQRELLSVLHIFIKQENKKKEQQGAQTMFSKLGSEDQCNLGTEL